MDLSVLKGTKDYPPEEQIIRSRIQEILRTTFERYGYSPLETPILNQFDLLASKYAGGAEILKETYRLEDQGHRDLGLRYDLTVPFARIVGFYCGQHQAIPLPLKRYEIGKVFRDGPVRSGRVREFTQCDVDVVGSSDPAAEAEMIVMAGDIFEALDLPVVVRVNHRKVLSAMLLEAGVPEEQLGPAILSIDKLEKVGWKDVARELREKEVEESALEKINDFFHIQGSPEEVLDELEKRLTSEQAEKGLAELRQVLELLPAMGFKARLKLVTSLARGLEIYTGAVFECFLVDQRQIASSLAAGGRFDEIIGRFLELDDPASYPAVGISFGLDVLYEAMKQKEEQEEAAPAKTVTQVYIVPIGAVKESQGIARQFREAGLNVDVAPQGKRIKKIFRYANQMDIPFVLTIGDRELEEGKFNLKDMRAEREDNLTLEEAIEKVKSSIK